MQEIVRGQQPMELAVDRLIQMGPLPVAWEDQRLLLGVDDAGLAERSTRHLGPRQRAVSLVGCIAQ